MRRPRPFRPRLLSQTWSTFVQNHARDTLACDFFVAVTATFRLVYVFLALEIGTRRIVHWTVTEHPTAEWTAQQFRSFLSGDEPYRFVAHDRDATTDFQTRVRSQWRGVREAARPLGCRTRDASYEQLWQVLGGVVVGLQLARRDVVYPLMTCARGLAQRLVGTIANVKKTNVVACSTTSSIRGRHPAPPVGLATSA
jgi:hypothetical protein